MYRETDIYIYCIYLSIHRYLSIYISINLFLYRWREFNYLDVLMRGVALCRGRGHCQGAGPAAAAPVSLREIRWPLDPRAQNPWTRAQNP